MGVSPVSYGMSFATGELVETRRKPLEFIAAQSLGEASTQFTLRTFHTGGDRTDTAEVTGLEKSRPTSRCSQTWRTSYLGSIQWQD